MILDLIGVVLMHYHSSSSIFMASLALPIIRSSEENGDCIFIICNDAGIEFW